MNLAFSAHQPRFTKELPSARLYDSLKRPVCAVEREMTMRSVPALASKLYGSPAFLILSLSFCLPLNAQIVTLDKGHQILIDRGLPIGGVIALTSDPFHLNTMQAGGFTMPLWAWNSDVSTLGAAPGAPWSRWVDYTKENDLTPAEQPYTSNLVQLQVGDEQDLMNNSSIRAATTAWFNDNRAKFPNTILYINQG